MRRMPCLSLVGPQPAVHVRFVSSHECRAIDTCATTEREHEMQASATDKPRRKDFSTCDPAKQLAGARADTAVQPPVNPAHAGLTGGEGGTVSIRGGRSGDPATTRRKRS